MDPMDMVRQLGAELSNWGRWGAEDERGTINLITPEAIAAAAATVRRGAVFSLALPLDEHGPMEPAFGRFNPIHRMTRYRGDDAFGNAFPAHKSSDDMAIICLQSSTQWDSLAHVWYDDKLYNGFSAEEIGAGGARRCAIGNWAQGIIGRAVLLDVARHLGVDCLAPGHRIEPDDLDAVLARQGVETRPGDIILLRTGLLGHWQRTGEPMGTDQPGITIQCARWLKARDIAAIAADNAAVEVIRPGPGEPAVGFHMVAIRDMGLALGEYFVLDALAEDCAADGVYEMLLTAAPLNFPRAVGTPLNPLAIK